MNQPAYTVARTVAPTVAEHLRLHRAALPPSAADRLPMELLPTAEHIEALVDAAFWASVRREEGYVPKISLAFLRPLPDVWPLMFATPLPLEPSALTRLAAAVEQPGIHLGVWPAYAAGSSDGAASARQAGDDSLVVWGTTHYIPPFCFVVEVVGPGLLVLKHRPRHESRKFVNLAVLEGDRIKIIDERASLIADCPALLTSMLGFDYAELSDDALNVQVQLAVAGGRRFRVVRGEDDRGAPARFRPQQLQHPLTIGGVQLAGHLVGQQDVTVQGESAGDGRALLLPAGELVDQLAGLPGEAERLQ